MSPSFVKFLNIEPEIVSTSAHSRPQPRAGSSRRAQDGIMAPPGLQLSWGSSDQMLAVATNVLEDAHGP